MTRVHRWGAPSVVVGGRIPQEVAAKMDRDCEKYGVTRTDILAYLLGQHYDYPVDSPFEEATAAQLSLDGGETPAKGKSRTRKNSRAA